MRFWFVFLVCALSVLSAGLAHAQSGSGDAAKSAAARALFEEGVQLTDAGKWPEAADRFRRALVLRGSPVIRYNLATALIESGRLVEGSELLREVERDESLDAKLRSDARTRLAVVSPRIGRLTIELDGPSEGSTVMLDDMELASVQIGVGVPVDPGLHHARVIRAGEDVDSADVELANGASQVLVLRTEPKAPVVATPAEAAATVLSRNPAELPADHGGHRRSKALWWGIGAGAVAVVAIVVVSVLVAGNSQSAAKTYKGDFDPPSIPVQVGP